MEADLVVMSYCKIEIHREKYFKPILYVPLMLS